MRYSSVVYLACAAILTGCFGGDVARVKESRMKGWPEFTVGQLLGKRKACSSVEWKNFTDTRDRQVVEYSCDYTPGTVYLQAKQIDDLQSERQLLEDYLANQEKSATSDQERIERAQARVRGALDGAAALEAKVTGLKADVQRLQQLHKGSSCQDFDQSLYSHPQVIRYLSELTRSCSDGSAARDPDFGRSVESIKVRALSWAKLILPSMESDLAHQENAGLNSAKSEVQEVIAYAQKNKENREKFTAQRQAEYEARIALIERRGANFQKVREVSQWTVQEQEPVYLGSRVDIVFSDGAIEQPVDAEFVFGQAAKDSGDLTSLYQFVLNQIWPLYGKKK